MGLAGVGRACCGGRLVEAGCIVVVCTLVQHQQQLQQGCCVFWCGMVWPECIELPRRGRVVCASVKESRCVHPCHLTDRGSVNLGGCSALPVCMQDIPAWQGPCGSVVMSNCTTCCESESHGCCSREQACGHCWLKHHEVVWVPPISVCLHGCSAAVCVHHRYKM